MFKPRRSQVEILEYQNGKMGISAVPGSGKTHTLSYLAAQLILNGSIQNNQEILIVTLVNSAVDNFLKRISGFVSDAGLLANIGYRVRTLHGLAHDIVRERPDLAGISDQFSIIDEIESYRMIDQISSGYSHEHPEVAGFLLKSDIDITTSNRVKHNWSDLITTMNQNFISQAKDYQLEPVEILSRMKKFNYSDILMEMSVEVYSQYQRGLRYRNSIDFSDLIRLAYRVLTSDKDYLERLSFRWPYILEDEAQDSSLIQENILRLLVGPDGNWVRVGDPNQAIYETFTTSHPKYLRAFLKEPGVVEKSLPNSGRSNLSIINLANSLINWTCNNHPVESLRTSLDHPLIQLAPPGDPQPNPHDHLDAVFIRKSKSSSEEEIRSIVQNIKQWLPGHENKTIAILCPITWYGEKVVEALQEAEIEIVEQLKTSQSTRMTARVIEKILLSLADPTSGGKLSQAFSEIIAFNETYSEVKRELSKVSAQIRKLKKIEDFFYPQYGTDWKDILNINDLTDIAYQSIEIVRGNFLRWHQAASLPIDQLVLTISQDIFTSPAELALSHKLALLLEFSASSHPDYGLLDFAAELSDISGNSRKFSGFSDDELRFDPDAYKGKVFISTYHKAKGMEWDRVYLLSVNNYDFPSAQENDDYIGEKWFIREGFNPHAELLDKLNGLADEDISRILLPAGIATSKSRLDYASERLRLLYVGITRAREWLVITWNTGTKKDKVMALPLEALHAIWKEKYDIA